MSLELTIQRNAANRAQSMNDNLHSELEQAAAVTGRLAHDFGNYLTGIMGFTELSLSQVPPDGLAHRYLQEVLQSAQQGAAWVHRLHLFCRRSPSPSWPTLLSSVLAAEASRLQSAGVQGPTFANDLPGDLPLLDIEAGAMQTIVTELVNNTREANRAESTITFTARVLDLAEADCREVLGAAQPGPHVELTVTDDGPGIAPEHHARLLREMFFTTKPKHRGLGLMIVYGILRRFRGGLRIAPPKKKGLTVQLYLPVAALEPADPAEQRRVLLVHANPLLLESMQKVLESRGFQVAAAGSPQAALGAYAVHGSAFALIVTELLLPHSTGVDLARRILALDPKANFLFLHAPSSFHALMDEELVERFPLLRWPTEPQAFLQAVQTSLANAKA